MKINKRSYAKLKANEIPEKKPYTRAKHLNKQHVVPGCPYNIVFRQGKQNQKLWSLIISLDSCRVGPKKEKKLIYKSAYEGNYYQKAIRQPYAATINASN